MLVLGEVVEEILVEVETPKGAVEEIANENEVILMKPEMLKEVDFSQILGR